MRGETYRGYRIYCDPPPIPDRRCDWHFVHEDYDGAPDANDRRSGSCASPEECRQMIDEMEDET